MIKEERNTILKKIEANDQEIHELFTDIQKENEKKRQLLADYILTLERYRDDLVEKIKGYNK